MGHCRRLSVAALAGLAMIAGAFGQGVPTHEKRVSAQPKPVPLTEQARRQQLEALLAQWERQSSGLKSLDVAMTRLDVSPAWGEKVLFQGRAYFQSPDLASVEFQKVDEAKKPPVLIPHERIICSKEYLLQYVYPTKQIFVLPLSKEDRKRALEEGPLPFLFNMRAKEIRERYELSLVDQNEHLYLLEIKPRLASDRETFTKAYLWLNKETCFPKKLWMYLPAGHGRDTRQYEFTSVKPNERLNPTIFHGRMIAGWKVVRNPDR